MDNQDKTAYFYEIHQDLPRQGPGSFESTRKAFSLLTDLPLNPRILDIGCGPGKQTLDLCKLTSGSIIGLDNHLPYIEILRHKVFENRLTKRVSVILGNMFFLPFCKNCFDIIWAEGSIFLIGFKRGLQEWRGLIKKGGYIAVTEISWIRNNIPEELVTYWAEYYPAMQHVDDNLRIIEETDYQNIAHFIIPESDWWHDYYKSLEARFISLYDKYKDNNEMKALIKMEEQEIDMYRQYSDYYGYVFYIARF
jgi:ubiquinone/menaquinone biosynthesis C-methylase UbiE